MTEEESIFGPDDSKLIEKLKIILLETASTQDFGAEVMRQMALWDNAFAESGGL